MADVSYHDLFITTREIPRTSIMNLPYSVRVTCTRVGGWEVWECYDGAEAMIAGEFAAMSPLRLDVNGFVLCDSLTPSEKDGS